MSPEVSFRGFFRLLFFFTVFHCYSCQQSPSPASPLESIESQQLRTLLTKALDAAGGLEAWNNKKAIRFKKYFALYDSLGQTENAVDQLHHYVYSPEQDVTIEWEKGGRPHKIHYAGDEIKKWVDGKVDPSADPQSLMSTVMSATFVSHIPFNFLDEGAELSYDGSTTLEDGEAVEVLKIVYQPDKYDNLTTADTWWVFFDSSNYRLLAYMVQHADHFSYVKNLSFTEVNGFLLPRERKSWRVNPDRSKQYLRAEYRYSDYELLQ